MLSVSEILSAAVALKKAAEVHTGLPPPNQLVGSKYYFGNESSFIVGSVTSVSFDAEKILRIYVSPADFMGGSILNFYKHPNSAIWRICVVRDDRALVSFDGMFVIY